MADLPHGRRSGGRPPRSADAGDRAAPDAVAPELAQSAVAHDVNQMLAVILGRVGLLLSRQPDGQARAHLQAIELACRDAAAIVARLRPVAGQQTASSCLPADQVAAAVDLIQPPAGPWLSSRPLDAPAGRWALIADVPADLAAAVPAQVLREVLVNLLLNALEAAPGGGTITVTARACGARVQLRVADDGPGFPTAPAGGDEVRAGGRPGRGIGLAGCRQLLARHGGLLSVEPAPAGGAVVILDLPGAGMPAIDPTGVAAARGTEAAAVRELSTGERVRVLVVDDEPAVREMLADVLAELGCAVATAPDAGSALADFRAGDFQIALLDQSLPGMAGAQLAAALRASDPCLAVFLMTGWGNEDALAAANLRDVDFTARKPIAFDRLKGLLEEAADLYRRRRGGPQAKEPGAER